MRATITRKGSFDSAHRVMHQTSACRFYHGHLYQYELSFEYDITESIGYAIDFKEIKRIAGQFIEDHFDHGFIANPKDIPIVTAIESINSRVWYMSLEGPDNFCNPTAENIAKELFMVVEIVMGAYPKLKLVQLRLYETPNCFVDCFADSISSLERVNFYRVREQQCKEYLQQKGTVQYDDRLVK